MNEYKIEIIGCNGVTGKITPFITKVNSFAENHNVEIQLFDARMIFGKPHLLSAFKHAQRSILQKEATTHSFGMEILLYASGERQIKKAITKMGIKKNRDTFIAIIIYQKKINNSIKTLCNDFLTEFHLEKNDSVIEPDYEMLQAFGLKKKAIKSVRTDQAFQLVLEKVALVDVIK